MELNLARDAKGNKKGFYKYINNKGKGKGWKMEEAEVLNALFTSVSTSKTSFQESQPPGTRGKVWKEDLRTVEEGQVREYVSA